MPKKSQISVTVKFFATLREYGPSQEIIHIPEKSTIQLIFEKYKIPREQRRTIIMVNGNPHQDFNTVLRDGDIIAIFPPIGGGF